MPDECDNPEPELITTDLYSTQTELCSDQGMYELYILQ